MKTKIFVPPHPGWLALAGLAFYLAGILWRYDHIFRVHPAALHVYSDMGTYFNSAINFFRPGYTPNILDTLYPPGTAYYFGFLHELDPSWSLAYWAQFTLSCLVPALLALLGAELYGKRVGWMALIMASAYFPFIDYAAFFLSENPFLFLLVLTMYLFVKALKADRLKTALLLALLAGASLGLAASVKTVVLGSAALVAAYVGLCAFKYWDGRVFLILAAGLAGLLTFIIPLAHRCTALNEGNYCTVNTNGGMNMLLGHYGGIRLGHFHDTQRHLVQTFGSPAVNQTGTPPAPSEVGKFLFGAYESEKAIAVALKWSMEHPTDTLLLSLNQVFSLFAGSIPWPGIADHSGKKWHAFFQQLYWILILLPALAHLITRRRELAACSGFGFNDWLMILPLAGLMIAAFFTLGEPRYRIPFDGFLMILAARWYLAPRRVKPGR